MRVMFNDRAELGRKRMQKVSNEVALADYRSAASDDCAGSTTHRRISPSPLILHRANEESPSLSPLRRNYMTFLLALVYMLASADRNIMSILLVPIQKELGASDTAMGLLTGAAFSIVYATGALPLARFADRGHRRNLLGAAVAIWSLMTATCGFVGSYALMLLARVGVALGEAGHAPAIMSLVGDLHPRERRGFAIGCVYIGSAVGVGAGAFLAGYLNDLFGWRVAFLAMGFPGLVVAALLVLTVKEPVRGLFDGGAAAPEHAGSTWVGLKYLWSVPTVRRLMLAQILLQASVFGSTYGRRLFSCGSTGLPRPK
jgi:predicted MFS family arabinose efflux permease